MIQSNYDIVFKLEVFHSYFENDVCNCLKFKPAAETLKLLNRFGFKMRFTVNGFDLYVSSKSSIASLLQYINSSTDQSYFDFEIESDNPAFSCFTDIPADWIGQLLYDSSAVSNIFENGMLTLAGNLSGKTAGSLTGKLSVRFSDILKYTNDKGYANLNIRLNARNTQWQYFIVNKSSVQMLNPFIKGNGNNIAFNLPEKVIIQSGHEALMFSSGDSFLQLTRKPKYRFSLMDHLPASETDTIKRSTDRVIFKGLPNPDPARISIVNINGKKHVSSAMYVFV